MYRNGPVQRTSITIILVFRPKRGAPSLSEFLELEVGHLNKIKITNKTRRELLVHPRSYSWVAYYFNRISLLLPYCALILLLLGRVYKHILRLLTQTFFVVDENLILGNTCHHFILGSFYREIFKIYVS